MVINYSERERRQWRNLANMFGLIHEKCATNKTAKQSPSGTVSANKSSNMVMSFVSNLMSLITEPISRKIARPTKANPIVLYVFFYDARMWQTNKTSSPYLQWVPRTKKKQHIQTVLFKCACTKLPFTEHTHTEKHAHEYHAARRTHSKVRSQYGKYVHILQTHTACGMDTQIVKLR